MTQIAYEIIYTDRKFFGREGAGHCIRIAEKDLPFKVQELTDRKCNIKNINRLEFYSYF